MERQNVTLSIPKDSLKKAKHLAVEKEISLSKFITSLIEKELNDNDKYEKAKKRQLKLMENGLNLGLKGKIPWSREELHER